MAERRNNVRMRKDPSAADDRSIEVDDPREIPYWIKFFDTTKDELLAAISAVGTSAEAVKRYLRQKYDRSGGQS